MSMYDDMIDFSHCNTPDDILRRYNEIRTALASAPQKDINRLMISLNKARGRRMSTMVREREMAEKGITQLYEEIPFSLTPVATLSSILPIEDAGLRTIIQIDSNGVMKL